MIEKGKRFHSFKEFGKAFIEENKKDLEMQKLLNTYGVDIPLELISDIEIIEKTKQLITYWNKRTNEIVTSNLLGRIFKKWHSRYSVSLTTCNSDKTFFIEHFNSIDPAKTYEKAGENALKSRSNPETKLLSRAYADISTKYGDFCLHLEENYTDYGYGPYRSISLYYGNHEQVLIDYANDFDFSKYCLFRCKYIEQSKFNQWWIGFTDVDFDAPKLNIWSYGETKNSDLPIYSKKDRTNHISGTIFTDGALKLEKNFEYIPEIFYFYCQIKDLLKQYEELDCTSKAYFGNYGEYVAILKQESIISIEYTKENRKSEEGEWENCFSDNIISSTAQEFTKNDFENIMAKIVDSPISDELKKFIISNLIAYINTHNENDFKSLSSFTLESSNFENILQYIKQQNLVELVENGLESLSKNFHINIDELLGQNPPNQTKEPQYVKNITKKRQ